MVVASIMPQITVHGLEIACQTVAAWFVIQPPCQGTHSFVEDDALKQNVAKPINSRPETLLKHAHQHDTTCGV